VATTEGSVVFENELFQLIEYKPLTAKVHERPMLFVPPCINKYYILDLQPENSVIRYTVEQGHRTFVVSWRNPDEPGHKTWDDYIEDGAIRAIRRWCRRSAAPRRSTRWASASAAPSWPPRWRCWPRAASSRRTVVTLLTTLLDFSRHRHPRHLRRRGLGAAARDDHRRQAPSGPGLLKGKELATTFSFLRPNDLVWNYVVGNYLKGEAPPPFDLLYWNGDSTNLPGRCTAGTCATPTCRTS
jgi:polyhydroxyalkanoate synthase